jgi:hypothetical protein
MEPKQRPFNTIITSIGDTFIEGKAPTGETIDLTKVSDEKLVELSKVYAEAAYEQIWRALSDAMDGEED